jgi:hypothetical protein
MFFVVTLLAVFIAWFLHETAEAGSGMARLISTIDKALPKTVHVPQWKE